MSVGEKVWWCVQPFRHNTGVWRTNGRTDILQRHSPRLCNAQRSVLVNGLQLYVSFDAETLFVSQQHSESANSAKVKIWSGIQIRISGLIRIRMFTGSFHRIHSVIGISQFAKHRNKNLAIASRSRVSCAHNTSRTFIGLITPWPWNLSWGSLKVTVNRTIG